MEEQNSFVKRIGNKDDYLISFDKGQNQHFLTLKNKSIKVICFYCLNELENNNSIYFCEDTGKFMCKECCISKHKPVLTNKNSEHQDIRVIIE